MAYHVGFIMGAAIGAVLCFLILRAVVRAAGRVLAVVTGHDARR